MRGDIAGCAQNQDDQLFGKAAHRAAFPNIVRPTLTGTALEIPEGSSRVVNCTRYSN